VRHSDAPMCMQCGVQMNRAGSCHACPSCGSTSGCSWPNGDGEGARRGPRLVRPLRL